MDKNELFEKKISDFQTTQQKNKKIIAGLEKKLENTDNLSSRYERIKQNIRNIEQILLKTESYLEFMRLPTNFDDEIYRLDILKKFPEQVKNLFPDGFPIVFHGTDNIGIVREILKSGGLLTPEQRGVDMTSFANDIDVTYKNNITISCEFAEPGSNSFMPYGAIFAFMPEQNEIEKVIRTGDSTEVYGGVNGVNFRDEPNRLYGVITSPENTGLIKHWCKEYGIDESKVFIQEEFISTFGQHFSKQNTNNSPKTMAIGDYAK